MKAWWIGETRHKFAGLAGPFFVDPAAAASEAEQRRLFSRSG